MQILYCVKCFRIYKMDDAMRVSLNNAGVFDKIKLLVEK